MPPASSDLRHILILKSDRFCASALRQVAIAAFPRAAIVPVARVAEARKFLRESPCDLLLSDVELPDGDVLDLLNSLEKSIRTPLKVLVVTCNPHLHVLETLRDLSVAGVFDAASEDPEDFPFAVMGVALGFRCWSASVLQRLSAERCAVPRLSQRLTPTEQLVLATVADGCEDDIAAKRLGVRAASVQSVRRSLHRKLGVQHKGQLVLLAAQHGCVRFTPDGVMRPGYERMLAAYRARKEKRAPAGSVQSMTRIP